MAKISVIEMLLFPSQSKIQTEHKLSEELQKYHS